MGTDAYAGTGRGYAYTSLTIGKGAKPVISHSRKKKVLEEVRKQRRRRTLTATAVIAVVMAIIVVAAILATSHPQSSSLIGQQIPPSLYNDFTTVSINTLNTVGKGTSQPLHPASGNLLTSNGKPEVFYVGAEFCPYCASERWSLIIALSKFGNFTGLTYMQSGDPPEPFPDTSTFSFRDSTYTSPYVSFVSIELYDRTSQRNPVQTLSPGQKAIFDTYDPSEAVPFIDIANRYTYIGPQYDNAVIQGLDWNQIASQLNNPSSGIAQAIDGTANTIITAICKVDGGQPTSLCSQPLAQLFMPITPNNMPLASDVIQIPSNQEEFAGWTRALSYF